MRSLLLLLTVTFAVEGQERLNPSHALCQACECDLSMLPVVVDCAGKELKRLFEEDSPEMTLVDEDLRGNTAIMVDLVRNSKLYIVPFARPLSVKKMPLKMPFSPRLRAISSATQALKKNPSPSFRLGLFPQQNGLAHSLFRDERALLRPEQEPNHSGEKKPLVGKGRLINLPLDRRSNLPPAPLFGLFGLEP